jgi:hypothetical protein
MASHAGMGGGMAMTFHLIGAGRDADLQKYLNSQVEVTGTMVGHDSSMGDDKGAKGKTMGSTGTGTATGTSTGAAGTAGGTATASGSQMGSGMQHGQGGNAALRVSSVRQISSTCSGGAER